MRRLSPLPWLGLLLVATAAAALWCANRAQPVPTAVLDAAALPHADPAPPDLEPALADEGLDAAGAGEAADAAFAPELTEVEDGTSAADDAGPGPLLTVVRGQPPVPVAGALVAWADRDEVLQRRASAAWAPWFDLPARFGRTARTGSDGTLRLPLVRNETVVSACADAEFAFGTARRGSDLRLELLPDESLRIAVLGEHGSARAGVPVAVAWSADGQRRRDLWNGVTDRSGLAELRHFQIVRPPAHPGERFVAAVTAPLPQPSFASFDGRQLPRGPVTLTLLPTRPLSVTVHHRSGAPLLASLPVMLRPHRTLDAELLQQLGHGHDTLSGRLPLGLQPLWFPHASPAVELVPMLRLPGEPRPRELPPWSAPGDGPAELRLVLPDDVAVVAARLLTAAGAPLVAFAVDWSASLLRTTVAQGRMQTLAGGEADLVFPLVQRDASAPLVLTLRASDATGAVLGCTVPAFVLLPGERRDLGALRLLPEPLIARGVVRDDLGSPRKGAPVNVQMLQPHARGERWVDVPMLRANTGDDGAFAVHGALPPPPFRVLAAHSGDHFEAASGPLAPGATVELRQLRAGVLQGQVLLPEWLSERTASVTLTPADGAAVAPPQAGNRQRGRSTELQRRNGWFWIGGLEPGVYTLAVTARNLPEPLAWLGGVRIDPGDNRDARALPLDLAGALFRYRLRAVGPGGPLAGLTGPILWHTVRQSGEQTVVEFRWQRGRAEFVAPAPFVDLTTQAPGFPPTRLSLAHGDHDVWLQPLQPFPVELPGVRALAGRDRAIRVSATFTGDTGLAQGLSGQDQRGGEHYSFQHGELGRSGGGWLDAWDRADLALLRGGPHEIVLRLYEGEKQQGRQTSIPLGTIEVAIDGSAVRPVVLNVDALKLQAALAQLALQPGSERGPPRAR